MDTLFDIGTRILLFTLLVCIWLIILAAVFTTDPPFLISIIFGFLGGGLTFVVIGTIFGK